MTPPDEFDPPIGVAEALEPGLRRIVAPNPSSMTYRGTNTYLLGTLGLAVIDPGPDHAGHLAAILEAVAPEQQITHIFVTHAHLDHSPLARGLSNLTGAPVYAFGPAEAGRSAVMQELAQSGLVGGGEGIDTKFMPDHALKDGAVITGEGWSLQAIHTPGHIGNHLCFGWNDVCFTADHVMGWSTSLVSPPDGDLTDFLTSCQKLTDRSWSVFYPGHGAPIMDPAARLEWLVAHRKSRETSILDTLKTGTFSAAELARAIYTDVPEALLGAAERNVLAHLIDLTGRNLVEPETSLHAGATFRLRNTQLS